MYDTLERGIPIITSPEPEVEVLPIQETLLDRPAEFGQSNIRVAKVASLLSAGAVSALYDASRSIGPDGESSFDLRILAKERGRMTQVIVFLGEVHKTTDDEDRLGNAVLDHFPRRAYERWDPRLLVWGERFSEINWLWAEKHGKQYGRTNLGPIKRTMEEEDLRNEMSSLPELDVELITHDLDELNLGDEDVQQFLAALREVDLPSDYGAIPRESFCLERGHKAALSEHLESIDICAGNWVARAITRDWLASAAGYSMFAAPALYALGLVFPAAGFSTLATTSAGFALGYLSLLIGILAFKKSPLPGFTSAPLSNAIFNAACAARERTMIQNLIELERNGKIDSPLLVQSGSLHTQPMVESLTGFEGWHEVDLEHLCAEYR